MNERFLINSNFMIFKIIIILNLTFYSILLQCPKELPIFKDNNCTSIYCSKDQFNSGECEINNSIIKTQWLNNIVKFDNTNGDIFIDSDEIGHKLVFSTTLSNNEDRIIYFKEINKNHFFKDNNETIPFIIKNIGKSKNNEMTNAVLGLIFQTYNYIILIGNENSDIEILNLDLYKNDYDFISQSTFLNENKIIKGISSYCKIVNSDLLYYASIIKKENDPLNYYISLYNHKIQIEDDKLKLIYLHHIDFIDVKSNYTSCFVDTNNIYFSCFYLNKNNNYVITLFKNEGLYFQKYNTLFVRNSSDSDSENQFFFKGISITNKFAIYAYYSGDFNEIPTFIFKSIDNEFCTFSDKFTNLPNVHLYDYQFNNHIKYNDLIKFNTNEFFFISTSKNKETLIISQLKIYEPYLAIRYFTIEFKKYYNMKIFQGFKAIFYNDFILTLAINYFYCSNELCEKNEEENINAGLIFFSYVKKENVNIDFIDYSFTYNRNYIIIDLAENYTIENNIFGMHLYSIIRGELDEMNRIEYFLLSNNEDIIKEETYCFQPENAKIKISFANYSLDEIDIDINYKYEMKTPLELTNYIIYTDKINNSYENNQNDKSYSVHTYNSEYFHYYININKNLSFECNDSNCALCLRNDTNYCLICNYEYDILYNKSYYKGKKKICKNIYNTDESSYSEEIITSKLSNIKIKELLNSTDISNIHNTSKIDIINTDLIQNNSDISTFQITTNIDNSMTHEIKNTEEALNNSDTFYFKKNENIDNSTILEMINTDNFQNNSNISYFEQTSNIDNSSIYEINNTERFQNNSNILYIQKTSNIENFTTHEITKNNEFSNKIDLSNQITINYEISTNHAIINSDELFNKADKSTIISTSIIDIPITHKIEELTNNIEITLDDLLNGEFKDINLSDKEIKLLYNEIKDYLRNNNEIDDTIIEAKNVKIQISSIDSQKKLDKISDINLGECGEILKNNYGNSKNNSLKILKFDITPQNKKSTYVQYKIYDPNTKLFLELKECSDSTIVINIPIDFNNDIESLYDHLSESGYNLFDAKSSFYNDICATYATQQGTDILLYDRRMDLYSLTLNISLCQKGCKFESYNSDTRKAKCNCPTQTGEINTNSSDLEFDTNKMIDEFYEILKNSNFKVLQCYKLPFNLKIFVKNIGSIVMTVLLVIFLSLIIIYVAKSSKEINVLIKSILKMKLLQKHTKYSLTEHNGNKNLPKNKKHSKNKNLMNLYNFKNDINNIKNMDNSSIIRIMRKSSKKKKKVSTKKTNEKKIIFNNIINSPPKRNTNKKTEENIEDSSERKNIINKMNGSKINNFTSTNDTPLNFIKNKEKKCCFQNQDKKSEKNILISRLSKHKSSFKKKRTTNEKRALKVLVIGKSKNSSNTMFPDNLSDNKDDCNNNVKILKKAISNKKNNNFTQNNELLKLNDQEMNSLEYEKAVKLDKRNYFQYYCSILKKNHLILFTFLSSNDYNVLSLKISLFIVSLSLYFSINAFFFSDTTMHKVYLNNGVFNLMHQIPQLFYSSFIPSIINMILKTLSLSAQNVIKLKREENFRKLKREAKEVERCIIIKFIAFFIISLLLMLFFWYFISCFCAVYNNTQGILFKDNLLSFSLSMSYPFVLNLIPGIFRIPALRANQKDKECFYKISQYLALIS